MGVGAVAGAAGGGVGVESDSEEEEDDMMMLCVRGGVNGNVRTSSAGTFCLGPETMEVELCEVAVALCGCGWAWLWCERKCEGVKPGREKADEGRRQTMTLPCPFVHSNSPITTQPHHTGTAHDDWHHLHPQPTAQRGLARLSKGFGLRISHPAA